MNRSASVALVISRSGSRRISLIASPTGVPPGSRTATHGKPRTESRSASRFSWVVLPAPSGPSNTISLPVGILLRECDDWAGGALLHSVHDPLVHAQHRLVEVLLSRHRALVNRARLDLFEQRVELLLHLGGWLLAALDELLRFATQPLHLRSEERRVGKECRARWSVDEYKTQKIG